MCLTLLTPMESLPLSEEWMGDRREVREGMRERREGKLWSVCKINENFNLKNRTQKLIYTAINAFNKYFLCHNRQADSSKARGSFL